MAYYQPDEVARVKEIDLLTYLQNYEPDELVHFSRNTYTTRAHDSLKISNGMWYWFSRGIGGKSALEYLIQVREKTFLEAMEILTGKRIEYTSPTIKRVERNKLILPKKSQDFNIAKRYLLSRGISENIIDECIDKGLIYQQLQNNNVVFVGFDESNIPKYAGIRGTNLSRYMHDAYGSDKTYSFRLVPKETNNSIHLFESAIDLLSYATIKELNNSNWYDETLIALSGIYQPSGNINESKIPVAISHYLEKNPTVNTIYLHLDNDSAGRNATKALEIKLKNKYKIIDDPPLIGKDYNDYLCSIKNINYKSKYERKSEER